ncbi:MAG: hypothetical protein Ct9H90mP27_1270 [Gammaproteobacteria bacterium]|nr:MAG: hypothetical protein Ct9H90mP27_1270 [Gammaproteobacteria bacterium]
MLGVTRRKDYENSYSKITYNQLNAFISEWSDALQIKQGQNLKLDLSRGKPSHAQLGSVIKFLTSLLKIIFF